MVFCWRRRDVRRQQRRFYFRACNKIPSERIPKEPGTHCLRNAACLSRYAARYRGFPKARLKQKKPRRSAPSLLCEPRVPPKMRKNPNKPINTHKKAPLLRGFRFGWYLYSLFLRFRYPSPVKQVNDAARLCRRVYRAPPIHNDVPLLQLRQVHVLYPHLVNLILSCYNANVCLFLIVPDRTDLSLHKMLCYSRFIDQGGINMKATDAEIEARIVDGMSYRYFLRIIRNFIMCIVLSIFMGIFVRDSFMTSFWSSFLFYTLFTVAF